jgi:hypothetical protein
MCISLRTLSFSLVNRMSWVSKARLHASYHHYEDEMIMKSLAVQSLYHSKATCSMNESNLQRRTTVSSPLFVFRLWVIRFGKAALPYLYNAFIASELKHVLFLTNDLVANYYKMFFHRRRLVSTQIQRQDYMKPLAGRLDFQCFYKLSTPTTHVASFVTKAAHLWLKTSYKDKQLFRDDSVLCLVQSFQLWVTCIEKPQVERIMPFVTIGSRRFCLIFV